MPKINIDDLIEPIEVTVGGKVYIVDDISRDLAKKITKSSRKAEEAQDAIVIQTAYKKAAELIGDAEALKEAIAKLKTLVHAAEDMDTMEPMVLTMTEVLGADKADIAALGMRKLLMLITKVMGAINEELEGKNAPKVVATK